MIFIFFFLNKYGYYYDTNKVENIKVSGRIWVYLYLFIIGYQVPYYHHNGTLLYKKK